MVKISRDDNVAHRADCRDFLGYGCSDMAGGMQHDQARGEPDRRHACFELRPRQSNRIGAKPYLVGDVAGEGHLVSSLAPAKGCCVNYTEDGWFVLSGGKRR